MIRKKLLLLATALIFIAANTYSQTCGAPGKDGPAAISGVVNTHYEPSPNATFGPGATSIGLSNRIGAATAIAPGDLVLVIQITLTPPTIKVRAMAPGAATPTQQQAAPQADMNMSEQARPAPTPT